MSDGYLGLEINSPRDPPELLLEPPVAASRCLTFGRDVARHSGRALRYLTSAFAISLGGLSGGYMAIYVLSKVAPIVITINIAALIGPDPN